MLEPPILAVAEAGRRLASTPELRIINTHLLSHAIIDTAMRRNVSPLLVGSSYEMRLVLERVIRHMPAARRASGHALWIADQMVEARNAMSARSMRMSMWCLFLR